MLDRAWLESLKPGDAVIVSGRHGDSIRRVARITATMVVLDNGVRFSRKHGGETGGSTWYTNTLEQPTPEKVQAIKESVRRKGLIATLRSVDWTNMDTGRLAEVVKAAGITPS